MSTIFNWAPCDTRSLKLSKRLLSEICQAKKPSTQMVKTIAKIFVKVIAVTGCYFARLLNFSVELQSSRRICNKRWLIFNVPQFFDFHECDLVFVANRCLELISRIFAVVTQLWFCFFDLLKGFQHICTPASTKHFGQVF